METVDWPRKSTQVRSVQFDLTRAYPRKLIRTQEVTHPKIAPHLPKYIVTTDHSLFIFNSSIFILLGLKNLIDSMNGNQIELEIL